MLPLHHAVYIAQVGCLKAAAANVETVFSGAGKFTQEASTVSPTFLRRLMKLHYNWRYTFLQVSIKEVVKRYLEKFRRSDEEKTAAAKLGRGVGGSSSSDANEAAPTAAPES